MRSRVSQFTFAVLGVVTLLCSSASQVFAGTVAPEIDASAFSAGLGLLTAGVLMIRARRRR
jgi:hypothetical protein